MIVETRADMPREYGCIQCKATKPIAEMVVVHRKKTNDYLLRPRCKSCHNSRERGHRREYKRNYLRRWRKWNPELNESYWRQAAEQNRSITNAGARARFRREHSSILIQGRLRRRLGICVSITEARRLAKKYGPCYPTRFGLTPAGLRECERIRSRMRAAGKSYRLIEIRMMVYEDGHYMKPSRQPIPFRRAAEQLRRWHEQQGHLIALPERGKKQCTT